MLFEDYNWAPSLDRQSNAQCPTRRNSLATANGSTGFSTETDDDPANKKNACMLEQQNSSRYASDVTEAQ